MTVSIRDGIAGSVATVTFLTLLVLAVLPWWLAAVLGACLYLSLRLCLTDVRRGPHQGGVTETERRTHIATSRRHLATIHTLIECIVPLRSDFARRLQHLGEMTAGLVGRFEGQPQSDRVASMLPVWRIGHSKGISS